MAGQSDPGLLEQICREEYKDKKGKTQQKSKSYYEKSGTHKRVWGNLLCLIPDFTVMASMRREMRGEIMGQLRRIFDGPFEKKVGTRVTKIWEGKMTMIAATTPIIDTYTSIASSSGERFIQINWRASRDENRGVFTLQRLQKKALGFKVKQPLKKLTRELFATATQELLQLPDDTPVFPRLSALSEIIADARASVYGHQMDTTYVIQETTVAEDIHRLIQEFYVQLSGVTRLQDRDEPIEQDIQDIMRCGIETLPTYRSIVLQAGIEGKKLSQYAGRDVDKRIEGAKLSALGIVEQCEKGDPPVKLRKRWQRIVDRCQFDFGSVFDADGAAAAKEKALEAYEQEKEIEDNFDPSKVS